MSIHQARDEFAASLLEGGYSPLPELSDVQVVEYFEMFLSWDGEHGRDTERLEKAVMEMRMLVSPYPTKEVNNVEDVQTEGKEMYRNYYRG